MKALSICLEVFVTSEFSDEYLLFCFEQESQILKFLGFMWNPLSWVMEFAAIMSIALANGNVSGFYILLKLLWFINKYLSRRHCITTLHGIEQTSRLARLCRYHCVTLIKLYNQFLGRK